MTAFISPPPRLQFFTNAGVPMAGGFLYTYAAGTTTPLVTYTDSTGLIANTNPVVLDSRGRQAFGYRRLGISLNWLRRPMWMFGRRTILLRTNFPAI